MNTNETTVVNSEESKYNFLKWIEAAIQNTSSYITSVIDNKAITIAIKGYGVILGKQSDGSYGISIIYGEKRKELTFKSIKDALVAFKDFIVKAWNDGKSVKTA